VARTINAAAFYDCDTLSTVTLPEARIIGDDAFNGCAALTSVDFPKATSIGKGAFRSNTKLNLVDLPSATSFARDIFSSTGTGTLTVTLGASPPTLAVNMFLGITTAEKSVIVKVPSGTTGYGNPLPITMNGSDNTANWANGFRGRGWDGNDVLTGTANAKIKVTIEADTP
jgi:hypothetical protein